MPELLFFNPWWEHKEKIQQDRYVSAFERSSIKWLPGVMNEIGLDEDAVYTLRGPRQVGKTTLTKLIIKRLLDSGLDPRAVFYYSCDLVPGAAELFEVIRDYHEFSDHLGLERRYVFLDEVSLVKDWQHAIKQAIDLGWGIGFTYLLTGSSAIDIKRGIERLPGRRGRAANPDKVLMPMSFSEFVRKSSVIDFPAYTPSLLELVRQPDMLQELAGQARVFLPKLSALLESYLSVGGFPPAVEEFVNTGTVAEHVLETYSSVVRSDFEKVKRSRILLRQVLIRILAVLGTPTSWQGLAKSVDTPSYRTVREYCELLADSFLMAIIYFLEKNRKTANPNKQKKFYFSDPLITDFRAGLVAKRGRAIRRRDPE